MLPSEGSRVRSVSWPGLWLVVIVGLLAGVSPHAPAESGEAQGTLPYYAPSRCGAISLYVICSLCGKEATIDEPVKLTETDHRGTTFFHLMEAAKAKGVGGRPMVLSVRQLLKFNKLAIVDIRRNHFAVVLPRSTGDFVVVDLPRQPYVSTAEEFEESWGGHAILFDRPRPSGS